VLAGCPVFPAANPWNQRVDGLPVRRTPDAIVRSIGVGGMHADFGSAATGARRSGSVRHGARAPAPGAVSFDYADESDRGHTRSRARADRGGGSSDGDRHVIVVDRARCACTSCSTHPLGGEPAGTGSGAIFSLRSNRRVRALDLRRRGRPADPPGLARYPG
jgi:hypothetical protein